MFYVFEEKETLQRIFFYDLQEDFLLLKNLDYFLMIQNKRGEEVLIASIVQNIWNILILNLDNSSIISRKFYCNYLDNLDNSMKLSRFLC